MRIAAPIDKAEFAARTRAFQLYLLQVAAVLLELFEGWLSADLKAWAREEIKRCARGVEAALFLMMTMRHPLIAREPQRGGLRPRSVRRGFRYRAVAGSLRRRYTHDACPGARVGALSQRLRAMIDALAHPERAIVRLRKRLGRLIAARLVAAAPPTLMCATHAPAPAPALADSS